MESDAHRVGMAGFIYLVKHCCLTYFKSDWLANVFFFFLSKEEEFLGLKKRERGFIRKGHFVNSRFLTDLFERNGLLKI